MPSGSPFTRTLRAVLATSVFALVGWRAASGGLVAHWTFDETSGTVAADSSGNGNDGSLTNMAGTEWTAGVIDGALEFDGVDDYVGTGVSLLNDRTTFTMAGWIKPAAAAITGTRIGLWGQNNVMEFGLTAGNAALWTPTPDTSASVPYTYPPDTWHHVTLVVDGTALTIYLDGSEATAASGGFADYGSSPYDFNIGGGGIWDEIASDGNWYTGTMDDVRVYDYALDAAAVAALYDLGAAPNVTIDSFTASPDTITLGGSSTLSWSTTNATSVSVDQGIGPVATDGSTSVSPIATTTYTITAEGTGGPVTQQATVTVVPADLTDPTVTIESPSVGEHVYDTVNVSGSASDNVGVDKVEVSISGGAYVQAAGSADWSTWTYSFDATLLSEGDHTIVARATDTAGNVSTSTVTITVDSNVSTDPGIAVTCPNGGETWLAGDTETIAWTSSGVTGDVEIGYSTDGGAGYTTVGTAAAETGSYDWTVPAVSSTQCRVKVEQTGVASDESDTDFAIVTSALVVEPGVIEFYALAGAVGGIVTRTFTVTYAAQSGTVVVTLDVTNLPEYLSVDTTGFSLSAGEQTSVTVTLDASAFDREVCIHECVEAAIVLSAPGTSSAVVEIRTDVDPSHFVVGCIPGDLCRTGTSLPGLLALIAALVVAAGSSRRRGNATFT